MQWRRRCRPSRVDGPISSESRAQGKDIPWRRCRSSARAWTGSWLRSASPRPTSVGECQTKLRRACGRGPEWPAASQPQARQDLLGDVRVGDEGDDSHAPLAAGTHQDVGAERALEQLGPGEARCHLGTAATRAATKANAPCLGWLGHFRWLGLRCDAERRRLLVQRLHESGEGLRGAEVMPPVPCSSQTLESSLPWLPGSRSPGPHGRPQSSIGLPAGASELVGRR